MRCSLKNIINPFACFKEKESIHRYEVCPGILVICPGGTQYLHPSIMICQPVNQILRNDLYPNKKY